MLSPRRKSLLFCLLIFSLLFNYSSVTANYSTSSHGNATTGVDGRATGYETGNCAHCHDQHASRISTATTPQNYLGFTTPNTLCNDCHDGAPAATNIKTFFDTKTNTHNLTGTHFAGESRATLSSNIHVGCTDCHNPHEAQSGAAVGTHTNVAPGVLTGAPAVNPSWVGAWTAPSGFTEGQIDGGTYNYEWQVCFRCHSSYNTALSTWDNGFGNNWTDAGLEFNTNNASYHPVVQLNPNRNTATAGNSSGQHGPVFVNGWTSNSTMQCSDCHSDETSGSPNGPHGSDISSLLIAPYNSDTGNATSQGDLCFKCHDYNAYSYAATCPGGYGNCTSFGSYKTGFSLSTDVSNTSKTFNLHVYHVARKQVSCTGCHLFRIHGAQAGVASETRGLLLWDADNSGANYVGEMKYGGIVTSFYQQVSTWQNSGGWSSSAFCDYNQTVTHKP